MKALRKFIEAQQPKFDKGGKLEKYWVFFDALATFAFTPGHTAPRKGAHIRDAIDLKRTMMMVILALVPCLIFGIWNAGHQHFLAVGEAATFMDKFLFGAIRILPLVVVSYGVGLAVEFIFCVIKGHAIQEGFLVSGMLIPLCLPIDVPLWMVAIATAFAVLIGKEVFGGTGMNILNVALTARAFLFFAYPTKMSGNAVWINTAGKSTVDGFTGATALGDAAAKMPMESFTEKYSLMEAFMGYIPGSIGETSTLMCLIGAGLLLFTGIASWRIMISAFVGGFVMASIFNWVAPADNTLMQLSPLYHLSLGGFAFGMVFMATDPVTAAQTNTGKIIYGFLIGFLSIMIRVFNPAYPEGVFLAILFMNVMAPLIDHYVIQANVKRRLARVKTANA
ncbi:NADH:ubiquinone reductase (Na(+)-transporting) subunit B [Luteibaculum oceani]|uniref:Na(+)-translocating NADH-quinone reductase subunit B n=1 Tax=Luteibaculum oceani TaxID=1294296 RepID=A0A5C6V125_9FLAO|nr:NADH:ubiquinone reductase (Na(+)-transporting) subunit B [Luteibaculum oceani]TXC78580.1 NADH:ubiquinone reductase (Na(+)-transporting) subunit B [Luteibaculum oceani]